MDGESVRVDNLDRLMGKVALWTDVSDGLIGPPQLLKEGGGKEEEEEHDDDDAASSTMTQALHLHLIFRLSSNVPADIDYQDLFPFPLIHMGWPHRVETMGESEERRAHEQLIAAFKSRVVEEGIFEKERDKNDGLPAHVVPPTDQVIKHFLVLGEWKLEEALEDFRAVREEAREVSAAYAMAAVSGGGREIGKEDDLY